MSDETRTPPRDERHHEVAAAYLDGVATPAEQAEVAASEELQALVTAFRVQAEALRDVPGPDTARREQAMAAALAEFDLAAGAPVAPPLPTNVVALRRTRRLVTIAAGVAAAGVIGVVGITSLGSDKSTGDSSRTAENLEVATLGSGDTQAVASDNSSDAKTDGSTFAPSSGGSLGPITGPAAAVPEIGDQAGLRELAQQGTATAFVAPSFEMSCPLPTGSDVVAEITWQGTPALVLRDTVTGLITAIDAQCTVLATVEP